MIVSLQIYLSSDTEWGASSTALPSTATVGGMPATSTLAASTMATPFQSAAGKTILWLDQNMHFTRDGPSTAAVVSGSALGYDVNDLKRKIVLGYGVLELMFSCWVSVSRRYTATPASN